MNTDVFKMCESIARRMAASFSRSAAFVGAAELRQEAWLRMLEAAEVYNGPSDKLGDYLAVSARRALRRMVFRMRVPVTVDGILAYRHGRADEATALTHSRTDSEALAPVASNVTSPEATVADREAQRRLAQLAAEMLANQREGEAVAAVLWGDLESAEAAAAFDLPVVTVYRATREAKRKLARCPRLSEVL
jgi:RNA polymerase sigma factor (sigma-70 family)